MNDPVTEKQARQVAEEAREQSWVRPSFGKELFLGRLRLDLIHPHPQPSPDDRAKGEAFLERLESFLSTVDPLRIERDARIPDDVIEGLAALGAFGMNIDEKYGGQGLSQVYYNRALILASSVHSAIGTLLTEPDVGSDPARMSTTAELSPDGRTYILNGTKLWITNGPLAKIMLVMARVPKTEGHRGGLTAFALEGDTPGIVIERRNEFMGIHGIENALIRLENVRVPAENMIGEEGRGLKIALTTLNTGRLSIPATSAGLGRYALKVVREFGRDRVQWGKPIGKHDAVAQKIAFIAGTSFAMDAVSELGAALADEEHNDIRIEAAVAKLWCTEMSWKVADDMVQVLGGRGYETAASLKARGEKPIPAEQMLRDVRVSRIFEGSSEIMRLFIAREAVDQHMQVAGALAEREATPQQKVEAALKASTFYVPWMVKLSYGPGLSPNSYAEFGRLATHLRFVERASRRLARWTFYGMLRWQAHLELRQSYLGRLVDIGAELFAMSATVVRAQMLGTEEAVELADLFCRGSRLRVEALFRGLRRNEDDVNYRAAQRALDGRYDFIEQGILDPAELIARGGMDSEELTTEEGSALVS